MALFSPLVTQPSHTQYRRQPPPLLQIMVGMCRGSLMVFDILETLVELQDDTEHDEVGTKLSIHPQLLTK